MYGNELSGHKHKDLDRYSSMEIAFVSSHLKHVIVYIDG